MISTWSPNAKNAYGKLAQGLLNGFKVMRFQENIYSFHCKQLKVRYIIQTKKQYPTYSDQPIGESDQDVLCMHCIIQGKVHAYQSILGKIIIAAKDEK